MVDELAVHQTRYVTNPSLAKRWVRRSESRLHDPGRRLRLNAADSLRCMKLVMRRALVIRTLPVVRPFD